MTFLFVVLGITVATLIAGLAVNAVAKAFSDTPDADWFFDKWDAE